MLGTGNCETSCSCPGTRGGSTVSEGLQQVRNKLAREINAIRDSSSRVKDVTDDLPTSGAQRGQRYALLRLSPTL